MGLRIRDLRVGGRYLHQNGNFIRTIDSMAGNTVYWHDECGPGDCTVNVFLKRCQGFAEEAESIQTPDPKDSPMTSDEKAQMKEKIAQLEQAVGKLSRVTAALMAMQATIARIVVPLAEHLDEDQKALCLSLLDDCPQLASELQALAANVENSAGV